MKYGVQCMLYAWVAGGGTLRSCRDDADGVFVAGAVASEVGLHLVGRNDDLVGVYGDVGDADEVVLAYSLSQSEYSDTMSDVRLAVRTG